MFFMMQHSDPVSSFFMRLSIFIDFLGGSVVKNPPTNAGNTDQSLGQENPLEKEMATHSSILVWKIPWTEEPCGLQSMGFQRVQQDLVTKEPLLFSVPFTEETALYHCIFLTCHKLIDNICLGFFWALYSVPLMCLFL